MHSYPRHIGDMAKDAGHLTMIQKGAYDSLLDVYYARERGIPEDQAHRLVSAIKPSEREAVNEVLKEFFVLKNCIWIQKRCEEEIAKFKEGEKHREEEAKSERIRQVRCRKERKKHFKILRSAGIHLPYNTDMAELRKQVSSLKCHKPVTRDITSSDTATHTHPPIPTSQEPNPIPNTPLPPDVVFGAGSGQGRAGRLPPVGEVGQVFDDLDPEALLAMPGVAIQRACIFVGVNKNTASKAVNRKELTKDIFMRHYADVLDDPKLINPLGILASRLGLSHAKARAR